MEKYQFLIAQILSFQTFGHSILLTKFLNIYIKLTRCVLNILYHRRK